MQALVKTGCIVPEGAMASVHQMDLRVGHGLLVLSDDSRFDDRIAIAMRDEYRLANFRQKVVIVERA